MPTYEMPLLLRLASKAEYTTTLKNVANSIFETGGFIRKIENWGNKELPCKAVAHGKTNTHAGHFMFYFDMPPSQLIRLEDDCKRNISIIKVKVYRQNESCSNIQCTLHEELLPPPYRPSVIKIMEEAKKHERYKSKFEYGDEFNYHPFVK